MNRAATILEDRVGRQSGHHDQAPRVVWRAWIGALALSLAGVAEASQAAEAPASALAAPEIAARGHQLDTGSFLFARHTSLQASVLYAGVGFDKAGMFFGIVQNARTEYRAHRGCDDPHQLAATLADARPGGRRGFGWRLRAGLFHARSLLG